jgi:hypothetical protein
MTVSVKLILRQVSVVLGIAIAWYAIAEFNSWLFASFEETIRANWIFLPAAFRPLIILMFGKLGVLGLILGAYLTVYGTSDGGPLHEITFSIILGITPWAAVMLGKWLQDIPRSLNGLRAKHIVVLCTLCAGANAVALNGYLFASGHYEIAPIQVLTVFIGDLLGAALVLFFLSNLLTLAIHRSSRR